MQLPLPVEPWDGELDAGPGRMPWCVQFWYPDKRLDVRKWSEDCLYSLIALPHNHSSKVSRIRTTTYHQPIVFISG